MITTKLNETFNRVSVREQYEMDKLSKKLADGAKAGDHTAHGQRVVYFLDAAGSAVFESDTIMEVFETVKKAYYMEYLDAAGVKTLKQLANGTAVKTSWSAIGTALANGISLLDADGNPRGKTEVTNEAKAPKTDAERKAELFKDIEKGIRAGYVTEAEIIAHLTGK